MDDSEHDDGATATTSTYELASLSRAERRPSRSEASRPFGFQAFTSLTPASAAPTTIPITPPDTPGVSDDESRGDVFLQSKDPYAPVVEESLPPTPLEPAFNGAGPFDSAAAIEAALKVAAEVAGADSNAAFESDPEDEAGTAHGGERELATLPRVDGGREALTFLAAAFCIEGLVWGLPYSVGVLHEYWSSHLFPGDAAESTLTLASTLSTGLLFFSGAPLGPLFTAFPWYEKHFQVAGLVIAVGGLIGSAFATQPWHLVLTFGILYPCSAATYMPCATNIFEWFQERRGLATGIMYAGTGTGGALYPIITTALLNKFGYKATMIALALSFAVLNLAALPFIRRRIPLAKHLNGASKRRMRPKVDFSFLKTRAAWIAFTFMTVTSLANFIPLLWIPCKCALKTARPLSIFVPVTDLCSSVRDRYQRPATQRRRPRLRHQRNHGRRQRAQWLPVRPYPVAHHRHAVDGDCGPVMCRPVGVRHQRRRTHGLCRRVGYHGRQSGGLLG